MAAESSSPHEDSKSSSDETDRSLDQNYEYSAGSGPGRSYECVFCRRGFTTAQALGGHMNIHRKHRSPKTNPSNNYSADHRHRRRHQDPLASSNLAADHEVYASFRPFFAIQSYPQVHFGHDDRQVHVNYQTYNNNNNLSTTWGSSNHSTRPSQDFNDLLRENWRGTALSLGIVAPRHEQEEEEEEEDDDEDHDDHNSQKILGDFVEDGVELDLELRLGYDP